MSEGEISGSTREATMGEAGPDFLFRILMAIGGILYMLLMVGVTFSSIGNDIQLAFLALAEIALSACFLLLTYGIYKGGSDFRLAYAGLSLLTLAGLILVLGFNAAYDNPGNNTDPWRWGISNIRDLFVTLPVNVMAVLMLIGTVGMTVMRLGKGRKNAS